jgi:uncharacterized protein YdaU (DUF1376 family)
MDWYPWHPARYREKTLHLTAEQDGIYRRLIDHYMETRKPLPDNDLALARIAGVDLACFKLASSTVKAFFKQGDGGVLVHFTCNEMLDEQDRQVKFHSERAKKGAAARHKKANEINKNPASSKQEAPLQLATIDNNNRQISSKEDIPPISPKGGVKPYTQAFESFWSAYPRKVNKLAASKAYITAIKQTGVTHENLSLSATQFAAAHRTARTEERFIPHPATWLSKGGWENDLSGIKPSTGATQPAANARGSQFSAVASAVAELLAESDDGTPSGSGEHVYPNLALPDSRKNNLWDDSGYAGGHDTTGGQTIDCDITGSIDG